MTSAENSRPPITPRFWPSWLAVGIMWLLGKTPQVFGLAVSVPMAWVLLRLLKRRRFIAQRNIERCFPDKDDAWRDRVLRQHFRSLARMVFESCWSWSASPRRLRRMCRIEGMENIERAKEQGGVIFITAHVTCIEMGGRITAFAAPNCGLVYRPLKNPVIEWYQNRCRARYPSQRFSKRDLRGLVRFLRKGGNLWYAPDQDFGPERSQFAPFFGIETATLEATLKLVEMSRSSVVPMYPVYDQKTRRYTATFDAALENFPSGNLREDLARINGIFEEKIRKAPEQYWWIHRRFKTRPEGEPPFYE